MYSRMFSVLVILIMNLRFLIYSFGSLANMQINFYILFIIVFSYLHSNIHSLYLYHLRKYATEVFFCWSFVVIFRGRITLPLDWVFLRHSRCMLCKWSSFALVSNMLRIPWVLPLIQYFLIKRNLGIFDLPAFFYSH